MYNNFVWLSDIRISVNHDRETVSGKFDNVDIYIASTSDLTFDEFKAISGVYLRQPPVVRIVLRQLVYQLPYTLEITQIASGTGTWGLKVSFRPEKALKLSLELREAPEVCNQIIKKVITEFTAMIKMYLTIKEFAAIVIKCDNAYDLGAEIKKNISPDTFAMTLNEFLGPDFLNLVIEDIKEKDRENLT